MSGAAAVGVALAFPLYAAAATANHEQSGVLVPGDTADAWRSVPHIAAVEQLASGFVGADTSGARSMTAVVLSVLRSREDRNPAWPAYPHLDPVDMEAAFEAVLSAIAKGAQVSDVMGNPRGGYRIVREGVNAGIAGTNAGALATMEHNMGKPDDLPEVIAENLTALGERVWTSGYRTLAKLRDGTQLWNNYYLGLAWRHLVYLTNAVDTAGSPIGGEVWDESEYLDYVRARTDAAAGWLGERVQEVGGVVVGVLGEGAWALLSSPVGVIAVGGLVWAWTQRGAS